MNKIPTVKELQGMSKDELKEVLQELNKEITQNQLLKSAGKLQKTHEYQLMKKRKATVLSLI